VKCPYCGEDVELWTDENEVVCTKCKKVVARQVGQCCLDWCKYARECVGEEAYGKYMKNRGKDKKEE
jgi:transcription initiation factor TFIIIB Brf1 subunit/transcription initiation factor TFIIB